MRKTIFLEFGKMHLTFNFVIVNLLLLQEVISLRLVKVVIPTYELYGGFALLECQYELNGNDPQKDSKSSSKSFHFAYDSNEQSDEGETLYSVKWYKDNEEFYRYVPKANPPQHSYKVEGIRVDHEASNNVRVKLKRLNLKSSGLYRCEVSAEAPNFSSAEGEGRMEVIYLPRDGPHISGEERQYQIGDTINLNCTSGKSHPAPFVEWLINDEPVSKDTLIHYPVINHAHGLVTTIVGLQLVLDGRHFQDGAMRVKCVASVSPILWQGGKESVVQRRPPTIENREAMLLVRSSTCHRFSNSLISSLIFLSVLSNVILKSYYS